MKTKKIYRWRLIIIAILVSSLAAGGTLLPKMPVTAAVAAKLYGGLAYTTDTTGGAGISNIGVNDYAHWAEPVRSYIKEMPDGYVSLQAGDKIVINQYSRSFAMTAEHVLEMELPLFGGCFMGSGYSFLVFGQENQSESDDVEVVRIVKYDKDWNRLASQSVYGANTQIPFAFGSVRMTETEGMLYIHTCHTMYVSEDGANHQANMTYIMDQDTMQIKQSRYNVTYGWWYVSHSLNQYVKTDGEYLYLVDQGDAYPRAVVLAKVALGDVADCDCETLLPIQGEIGASNTGVSVGGFEITGDCLVMVGNSVSQDALDYNADGPRNIFVTSTDIGLNGTQTTWLTSYGEKDVKHIGTPHLVRASDNDLYVLWEEGTDKARTVIKVAHIDAQGKQQGEVYTFYGRLSDCASIYTSQGEIVWYTTSGGTATFYHIDPEQFSEYKSTISVSPAELVFNQRGQSKTVTATVTPEQAVTWESDNEAVATVKDGIVTAVSSGTADIIARAGDKSATVKVTVDIKENPTQQPSGSTGGTGNAGNTGDTGNAGSMGSAGSTGSTGGNTGNAGSTGGSTGSAGSTGGNTVGTGSTGNTGNTGSDSSADKDSNTGKDSADKSGSSKQPQDTSDKNDQTQTPATATAYEKGTQIRDKATKAVYEVTKEASESGKGGTIAYKAPSDKKASSVQIPKTVTLDGVTYKVTSVAANAFRNNKSLKKVTVGTNVTSIGRNAFYGCAKLKTITIGSNVKTIGAKAFGGCTSLTKVALPAKTTSIGKQAFYKCTKLKAITIKTTKLTTKTVNADAFKGVYAKVTVKVPAKAYSRYKKLLPSCGLSKKAKIVKQ